YYTCQLPSVSAITHTLLYIRLSPHYTVLFSFFFQAEDGIRDRNVTGVQTCALPISPPRRSPGRGGGLRRRRPRRVRRGVLHAGEIGRASCRERAEFSVVSVAEK